MKTFKLYFLLVFSFLLLAGSAAQAQAPRKTWSNKAKGAAIGGGAGAVTGAVLGGGKGAIIGGAAGAVGGGLLGRRKDKRQDPARYDAYHNKRK